MCDVMCGDVWIGAARRGRYDTVRQLRAPVMARWLEEPVHSCGAVCRIYVPECPLCGVCPLERRPWSVLWSQYVVYGGSYVARVDTAPQEVVPVAPGGGRGIAKTYCREPYGGRRRSQLMITIYSILPGDCTCACGVRECQEMLIR